MNGTRAEAEISGLFVFCMRREEMGGRGGAGGGGGVIHTVISCLIVIFYTQCNTHAHTHTKDS